MPELKTEEEYERCWSDVSLVIEKADSCIKQLYSLLETVKAQSDAASITAEQKFVSLSSEFADLRSQTSQLSSSLDNRSSELAQLQADKHQIQLQSIYEDREIERLSVEASELYKSKRQLIELVDQKDLEISEKNSTSKGYLDKIVNLTEDGALREAQLKDIEADLARSNALSARLSQEKELIERHNVWLNDELTAKVNSLIELRISHSELEADMSAKLEDAEKKIKEVSTSLKWKNDRIKVLELKIDSIPVELCSNKDAAAPAEERFSAELSTVTKLVELYKESVEKWSKKAGELEGVIRAIETHLLQVQNDYKERLEKEESTRKEYEKVEKMIMDPESEFLASKEETGNEWEMFKENVRPLKRGRNIRYLNDALKSHTHYKLRKSLLDIRRQFVEAIDEYKGEDPLHPWIRCIKWVQESFPPGGDSSGLVVIYEQCVRTFWHEPLYREDIRYLKVWLEYAENCTDAEVVYSFLDANGIGQTHSTFFISYALHMESKNKTRIADEIFNRGLSKSAKPIEKLKAAYRKFLSRSIITQKATNEGIVEPVRSFGTVLARDEARNQSMTKSFDGVRKKLKQDRANRTPMSIYTETTCNESGSSKPEFFKSWDVLGPRVERNKENSAKPAKWTSNKIPQRSGLRIGEATTASVCIEVFVDEECTEMHEAGNENGRSSSSLLRLRGKDSLQLKKETELLKENPLRNFPPSSMPR